MWPSRQSKYSVNTVVMLNLFQHLFEIPKQVRNDIVARNSTTRNDTEFTELLPGRERRDCFAKFILKSRIFNNA